MAAAALVAAAATVAHAAGLPLVSEQMYASARAANALPAQLANDDFNSGSTSLSGRVALTGQPWGVVQGAFGITSGQLRCTTCNSYGVGLVDTDLAQVTASVDVRVTNGGASGLMMNADQNGAAGFAVWYDGGAVSVLRYTAGTTTLLAQATVAKPANNTLVPLVVTYQAGVYTVSFNGAVVLTYTLGSADRSVADAGTYFGVVMKDPVGSSRLDNFQVRQ